MRLTVLAKRIFPDFKSRQMIRRAVYFPLDVFDFVTGRRDRLAPPRGLWYVGGGHFCDNRYLESFVRLGNLQPRHRVLDVGSGIGKQAVPLTRYLDPTQGGAYEGFDVVEDGVKWCQREISRRFPNFAFRHVDVFNKHYNPHGKMSPSIWEFPYSDAEFDFAIVNSVFTHMLPDGVHNYVNEISRVLKPGGKSFITYFLLNDESRRLIAQGRSTVPLLHQCGDCLVLDRLFPETAVGISEDFVKRCYIQAGLGQMAIHFGSWCGRKDTEFYQDTVIAVHG